MCNDENRAVAHSTTSAPSGHFHTRPDHATGGSMTPSSLGGPRSDDRGDQSVGRRGVTPKDSPIEVYASQIHCHSRRPRDPAGFKSRSDHSLNLILAVPGSASRLNL